jgi:hypothetical protein
VFFLIISHNVSSKNIVLSSWITLNCHEDNTLILNPLLKKLRPYHLLERRGASSDFTRIWVDLRCISYAEACRKTCLMYRQILIFLGIFYQKIDSVRSSHINSEKIVGVNKERLVIHAWILSNIDCEFCLYTCSVLLRNPPTVTSKRSEHCACPTPLADMAVNGSLRFPNTVLLSPWELCVWRQSKGNTHLWLSTLSLHHAWYVIASTSSNCNVIFNPL